MLIFSIKAQTSRCLSYKCSYTNSTAYSYSCRKALPFYPKGETLQRAAQRAERVQQQCLQMLQIHRLQALIRSQFPHSCKNRDPFFLNVVYFLWFLAVKKKKSISNRGTEAAQKAAARTSSRLRICCVAEPR